MDGGQISKMPNRKENFFICRIHKCVGKADDESVVQVYTALYVKPCVVNPGSNGVRNGKA